MSRNFIRTFVPFSRCDRRFLSRVTYEFPERRIALVKLNVPDKLNALTEPMGNELISVVEELKTEPELRAVVLTGSGRAFSAGGDLDWLLKRHGDSAENNRRIMMAFYKKFLSLRSLPVPVIGAINGPAIGAGMCLALGGCDIRVAHTEAKLGVTFVKLGLHPGMGATHFLPSLVGPSEAARLLLTGKTISADDALRMNIVSMISEDPVSDAISIAEDICLAAPVAVKTCLETLRKQQDANLEEALKREADAQSITYPTSDLREGVEALLRKREPQFVGN